MIYYKFQGYFGIFNGLVYNIVRLNNLHLGRPLVLVENYHMVEYNLQYLQIVVVHFSTVMN